MKITNLNEREKITVALIVGGLSKRFGSLKQLAELHEHSLLDYSVSLAQQISGTTIMITGPHHFGKIKNIPQYNDLILHKGPMGGILTALHYCSSPYCAMVPCDMPYLDSTIYQLLIHYLQTDVPVVAQSHRGIEPLVSIWPKTMLEKVRQAVEQDKLKLFLFLKEVNATFINIQAHLENYNPLWFSNVNTKEDLERLKQYHAK